MSIPVANFLAETYSIRYPLPRRARRATHP